MMEETKDPVAESTETFDDLNDDAQFCQHEVSSIKTNSF
jgi:hypothetical protein